ncbi:MAG: YitT family protein [Clostridia bacterium]|nr:YitT family protein [Clostridia bacterium]
MTETEEKPSTSDDTMYETSVKKTPFSLKTFAVDLLICFVAAFLVSFSLYYFSNYNNFAPGGITGFASIIGSFLGKNGIGEVTVNMSILMFLFNLPIFIALAIFKNKKTGVILILYLLFQSVLLMIFKQLHESVGLPYYAALHSDSLFEDGNNVVFAAIGVGVISGLGYSLMLRRFGASGGTYAIAALVKHFRPEQNIAWLSFALDSSVVLLALFTYDKAGVNAVVSTLTNIFISDLLVDYMLQGMRSGYKFEVITDRPEELAQDIMTKLHRGVTLLHAEGMYTHTDKAILICIVRKYQIGEFLKLLKTHNATFSYSCKINEVYGKFNSTQEDQKSFLNKI